MESNGVGAAIVQHGNKRAAQVLVVERIAFTSSDGREDQDADEKGRELGMEASDLSLAGRAHEARSVVIAVACDRNWSAAFGDSEVACAGCQPLSPMLGLGLGLGLGWQAGRLAWGSAKDLESFPGFPPGPHFHLLTTGSRLSYAPTRWSSSNSTSIRERYGCRARMCRHRVGGVVWLFRHFPGPSSNL